MAVLRRGEQTVTNRFVLGATGLGNARGATGKRVGLEGAALGAEHQLRGGTHQVASAHAALALGQAHRKVECGTLLGAQVVVQRFQVESAGCVAGGEHTRKHDFAQLTRLHALHGGRHGGTEPVVLAAGDRYRFGKRHGLLGDRHLLLLQAFRHEEVGGHIGVKRNQTHDGATGTFRLVQGIIEGDRGHRTGCAQDAGAGGKDKVGKVRHRTSISGVWVRAGRLNAGRGVPLEGRAAVGDNLLHGDVACRLRNEESVDRRNIRRVGNTAQRNAQAERFRVTGNRQGGAILTLPGVSHHGGSGGAGADRVHANTVRGKLQAEAGTHARRRRLRCTVGAKLRAGHTCRVGGDRHQGAAVRRVALLLVNHDACEFAQAQEHAVGVDRVQALPGVETGF